MAKTGKAGGRSGSTASATPTPTERRKNRTSPLQTNDLMDKATDGKMAGWEDSFNADAYNGKFHNGMLGDKPLKDFASGPSV